MVALRDRDGGLDYSLCDQTVTVYHRGGRDEITRTVFPRAFLDYRKNLNVDRTGATEANGFLLVIPGRPVACEVGDKVMRGEGPEVSTDAEWRELVPAKVDGLVVVKQVDPKYRHGLLVHTEAGG